MIRITIARFTSLLLISLLCLPFFLSAQDTPSHQIQKLDTEIQVDGVLREKDWQQGKPITGFRQFEPDEGAPATFKTEVRVIYGNGNIYVGAKLYDDNPEAIEQTLGQRDSYNRADWFLISLDSYFNRRTAFTFGVNAAGVQYDSNITGEDSRRGGGGPGDSSWDAIWDSAVKVTDEGWIVEMRIPYSMLRFPETDIQKWGIHLRRRIPRLSEEDEWPLIPRTKRSNLVAQFGKLTDIRNIEARPNVQVRPYMVAGLDSKEKKNSPGEAAVSTNLDVGGDIKVGLGSNITLDMTVNPDFGQVESDPAVLNLTAFETFFDEKRPFFIEGIQIFSFDVGRGQMLYTRRIGAKAPIIGAAKVSGRTERGLSFGVLGATTGEDFSPARNYGTARVSQQIGSFSNAGGILTFFEGPGKEGRKQSLSGGTDWDMRFDDNRYGVSGFTAFTHLSESDVSVNPTTGYAGRLFLSKRQGIFNGFAGVALTDNKFDPNDVGQLRRNNYVAYVSRLEYQINGGDSFGPVRRASTDAFISQSYSYEKYLERGLDINGGSEWTLKDFSSIELGLRAEKVFGGYDMYETRGLGPWAAPSSVQLEFDYRTDSRRNWWLSPEGSIGFLSDGGNKYGIGFRGGWSIGTRVTLDANLQGKWEDNVSAWVSNESFRYRSGNWQIGERSASPDELSSSEYYTLDNVGKIGNILSSVEPYESSYAYYVPVFGRRDTRSLDFTLRSDVTFTTRLSLQIYSQLFLARGRYDDFRILQNRDQSALFPSYPKKSAFTLSSFQSNVVLRWEYRRGSNMYLVWTHGRQLRESLNPLAPYGPSPYDQGVGERISDTFSIFPQNALLFKIEYTFLY